MQHLPPLITDLALILSSAAIITLIFKRLKQPVVLGYIVAGLIVGPNFNLFPTVVEVKGIQTWAEIGVLFLLFGLGLEFSFKKLLKVGGVALVTALIGVAMTMFTGFLMGKLLGWGNMDCLFLGGILAIASTTIIIRAFDELSVKTQKFAGIVMGVLVIEDLVAVVLMVVLSTVSISRSFEGIEMVSSLLKLIFFLVLWFISGIYFLPTFLKAVRKLINEETLLIVSLALCFAMVVFASRVGFSPALGAFIMGSILAETTKSEKIEQGIKSLKNLFGAIFFVSVGMLIDLHMLAEHALPVILATLTLLIVKPFFVTVGALITGQPLKVAVQSGMSLSQIGEFSFIIATLGLTLNVTSDFLYPIAVAVSVLTTFTTPYMIRFSGPFYTLLNKHLPKKWTKALDRYGIGTQKITEIGDWKKLLRFYALNVVVFSVVIITIILLSTEYLAPVIAENQWSNYITAFITLVVLSPFLWALAFRRTHREAYANVWMKRAQRGPLIVLLMSRIALAVFYIGFLLDRLFSPGIAVMGVILTVVLLILFRRRIKAFYRKIEIRFLSNLNDKEPNRIDRLTPWDSHLAVFEMNALFPFMGMTLVEAKLREKFGINVVAIKRDDITINVPARFERIYPHDTLSVIGTDEQLNHFRKHLETFRIVMPDIDEQAEVALRHFTITDSSTLPGKSIRESAIRESTKGLVVGIERNGSRLLNPESDIMFERYDTVWLVGDEKLVEDFIVNTSSARKEFV